MMIMKTEKGNIAIAGVVVTCLLLVFVVFFAGRMFESVDANEIVVIQDPIDGDLHWYTSPGTYWQNFGKATSYPKRSKFETEQTARFNDGGHGTMKELSIQWEMPMDVQHLTELHTKFGSAEAIEKSLIAPVVVKSVYMTGPLMSSKESYAEKRNYLISYVEDQIAHGVYKTTQQDVRQEDPLTKQEKTVVTVTIVQKNGVPDRQEESPLDRFGIRTSNFSFKTLEYDAAVEAQIQGQQKITMDVQTAIAESRKAEQRKLTVEAQGAASAAEAKWQQEVVKAKAMTEAQQQLEVSTLQAKAAEQYKIAALLKAEGDAGYRRKMMEADNALQQRLDAAVKINAQYADAIKNFQGALVPNVVMGGGGKEGGNGSVADLISLLVAQTAAQTGLTTKKD
jgi:hypothetical protein